jgi:hypothetical protein
MILVRDVFQLKFGKARDAQELWKEGTRIMEQASHQPDRILTDLSGNYYTLVLESTYENLTQYENSMKENRNEEWQRWYKKFTELVESGHREIFNIVQVTDYARTTTEKAYASSKV